MNKKCVSVSLNENVIAALKAAAKDTNRSFSQYVNMVLRRYIENKEKTLDEK